MTKVAVITGGGTGIGAATAEELAASGVSVVIIGRRPNPLHEVAERIRAKGGVAVDLPADISDWKAIEQSAREVLDRFGQIDLLVPNASIHDVSLIADGDPLYWKELIEINVVGLFNTVRAFLPSMLEHGSGHVIVVSSLSGRTTYVGEATYVASKHAQVAWVDCLRQEVSPKGIRVTIVEPGMVETPMIENEFAQELKKSVTPLDAVDCARAIRFIFEQPANCAINEWAMRPIQQLL